MAPRCSLSRLKYITTLRYHSTRQIWFHICPACPQCQLADQTTHGSSGPSSQLSDRPIWTPSDRALIKHIPKSARPACASHLASLLRSIVQDPVPITKWTNLFNWGGAILKPPKRGGKRHNVSATIKKRISTFPAGFDAPAFNVHGQRRIHTQSVRQWQPNSEDVNVRAAVRILISAESPAVPSDASLSKLRAKHPPASGKAGNLPAPQQDNSLLVGR